MNNEQQDRAIHDAANLAKADLTTAAGVTVATGSETTPPPRFDPNEARKALFAKSNLLHEADSNNVRRDNSSVDDMARAMESEQRGNVPSEVSPPPSQQAEVPVSLTHQGRTITVARSDIERAGGEQAYLRERQLMDMEATLILQGAEMAQQREQLRLDAEQLTRLQAEQQAARAAGHDDSAISSARNAGQNPAATAGSGDASVNLEARANALFQQIYSGDPNEGLSAVREILTEIANVGKQGQFSADDIANLAAQKIQRDQAPAPAAPAAPTPPRADPVWERERARIDAMARAEFPDLVRDPNLTRATTNEILRLSSLPQNRDRLALDIAREACSNIHFQNVRGSTITLKQGLPSAPNASGSAPVVDENQAIPTGSAVVAMMQARRQFGPRTQ